MKSVCATTLLMLAMSATAYERYPAWIAGFIVTDEAAYIFLPYAGDREPVVESVLDLRCVYEWTRPAQQSWIIGDYWCIRVYRDSDRCFYRAYRTSNPIHELNGLVMPASVVWATTLPEPNNAVHMRSTCGGWDGRWG